MWYILGGLLGFIFVCYLIIKFSCEKLSNDDPRALSEKELKEHDILKKEIDKNENLDNK